MIYSAISQVECYWHGLYHARGEIPARNEVDPRGIEQVLEYAMLMERIGPGIARIRLAGMHLTDYLGIIQTNKHTSGAKPCGIVLLHKIAVYNHLLRQRFLSSYFE